MKLDNRQVYIVQSNKANPSVVDLTTGVELDLDVWAAREVALAGGSMHPMSIAKATAELYKKPMFVKGGKKGEMGNPIAHHSAGYIASNINNPFWYSHQELGVEADPEVGRLVNQLLTEVMFADPRDGRYVGWWLAQQVLKPCEKARVCLVINGEGGTGKNALMALVERAVNHSGGLETVVELNSVEDLEERFYKTNFVERTLVYVSEAATKSRKITNKLKSLATADYFEYEAKGSDQQRVNCYADIALLSNEDEVLPLDVTNRKFAFVKARRVYAEDGSGMVNEKLWGALFDLLDTMSAGQAAVSIAEALRPFSEVPEFRPNREYVNATKQVVEKLEMTDALADQKQQLKDLVQHWGVFTYSMAKKRYEERYGKDELVRWMGNAKNKAKLLAELGWTVVVPRTTCTRTVALRPQLKAAFGSEQPEVLCDDTKWFKKWSQSGKTSDAIREEALRVNTEADALDSEMMMITLDSTGF